MIKKQTPIKYAVIGASNIDIGGQSNEKLNLYDSNIGTLRISSGGVARNIAENLARLEQKVTLFSAFSTDIFSKFLQTELNTLAINYSASYTTDKNSTCSYLFVNDNNADMHVAINDMQLIETIPLDYFKNIIDSINAHDICILDTNLSQKAIEFLSKNVKIPLYVDPVSLEKGKKMLPYLSNIYAIKPNLMEALALTNTKTALEAAQYFLDHGVHEIYISLGKNGLFYKNNDFEGTIAGKNIIPVNTTGAGDTITSVLAYAHNRLIQEKATMAVHAAELCIMSEHTVTKNLQKKLIDY